MTADRPRRRLALFALAAASALPVAALAQPAPHPDPARATQNQGAQGHSGGAAPHESAAGASHEPAARAAHEPAARAPHETAPRAGARGGSVLPGGDSREPVVIDADKLEWFDKEQKAIYTGHVVARQGESTLKASQLRIFMLRPEKGAAATPAPSGPGGDSQIERMEAEGPVELIQKDQTATGDSGLYERARNAVTLIGHVSLKQGPNITYGDRLVYDLDTRQAVVQNPRGTFAPRAAPDAAVAPKR